MPRPSRLLVANSLVFIGTSLFIGGLALASFADWDPCVWIGSAVLVGPSFALAWLQYRATFQASQRAAKVLMCSVLGMALLVTFGTVASLVECLSEEGLSGLWGVFGLFLILALIASWLFGTARFMSLWRKQLIDESKSAPEFVDIRRGTSGTFSRRFSLRELLGFVAAISVVLGGAATERRSISPQFAMHVSAREAGVTLPLGAHDVCVVRGYRGTITYDFAIDEQGFLEWAKDHQKSNIPLDRISSTEHMFKCSEIAVGQIEEHSIERGWKYFWSNKDMGVHFCYDADVGRVYFHSHMH